MNRSDFLCAAFVAVTPAASAAATPITAEIGVHVDSDELLAPFTVTIAVRNAAAHDVALDFPTADIYRIDVRHADQTVWSTATGHKPLLIARRIDIAPGLTRLASQIVDGTTDDRRAYAPGLSVVRVAMLGSRLSTTVERSITFRAPIPIVEALAATGGRVVTIAGEPLVDAGVPKLRDASGSVRLSRPLGPHPAGTYVVRGFPDATGNDVVFAVGRFAPAFDNLGTSSAPPSGAPR